MVIKELKYYLKNEMSLEEIQSNILEKINKKCDATTGYMAHVYDSSALKYYVVVSDNIVESYKLNKNILVYNDFKISYDGLGKIEESLNTNQSDINNKKDELSSQETLKGQLEQEISQLDRDIVEATNRSEDTTELERQKEEKERELANLTQNITDITNEINNLEQIRNDLLTQKDNIEKELEDYKLATKKLIDNLKANLDSKSSELNSRIDSVNSNLTNIINTKANQDTTYTKDETYNKTEVDDLVNTKANADAVVNLTSDQTIEGVKTFSMVPIVATQPTDDNQVANKAYVDSKAVSSGSGDATKASWGLNWAAGIELPNCQAIEAPSDGVVFLFVRRRMSGNLGTTHEAFYLGPKNNNPKNVSNSIDPNSFINGLFCRSELGQYDSVDSGASELSFFTLIPVTPNRDGEAGNYVSSLSSVPVRKGDQLEVDSSIIAKDYSQDKYDEYLLQAVFFPFEK